jgi:hypothetical protein
MRRRLASKPESLELAAKIAKFNLDLLAAPIRSLSDGSALVDQDSLPVDQGSHSECI